MPVSRLLLPAEQAAAPSPRADDVRGDHLGLAPLREPEHTPDTPLDHAAFATAIGPLGPVRAARWNRQLPASAGVAADEPAGSSPNA